MSLHNAVHVLLEVAAGRRNLSAAEADQLHDEIDAAGQDAPAAEPAATPDPTSAPPSGSSPGDNPAEGVNLDAPTDA